MKGTRQEFELEALEPRLLLSAADVLALAVPVAVTQPTIEVSEQSTPVSTFDAALAYDPSTSAGLDEVFAETPITVTAAQEPAPSEAAAAVDAAPTETSNTQAASEDQDSSAAQEAAVNSSSDTLAQSSVPESATSVEVAPSTESANSFAEQQVTMLLAAMPPPETSSTSGSTSQDNQEDSTPQESGRLTAQAVSLPGVTPWTEQGPGPIGDAQVLLPDENNPTTGAVQDVIVDPSNPKVIYLGTAGGGVWKTTDGSVASPIWLPKTDQFPSLSVSALAIDLNNSSVVYAGTGSYSAGDSAFSGYGNPNTAIGVLKSLNGGNDWVLIGARQLQGRRITGIVAQGANLVVSTETDVAGDKKFLFLSTNANDPDPKKITFTAITKDTNNAALGPVSDLISVPGSANVLYAGVALKGVYRSSDSGATWKKINTGIQLNDNIDNDQDGSKNDADDVISCGGPRSSRGQFRICVCGVRWFSSCQ